jgi:hypothetical protein
MGILDDAIREHLDLKRRQGVEEGELAKLEDEAFGPPSRPGDPDFPDDEAAVAASTAVAEPETGETPAEGATEVAEPPPPEPAEEEPPAAEAPSTEAPAAEEPAPAETSGFYDHSAEAPAEPQSEELELEPAQPEPPAADPEPTPVDEAPEQAPAEPAAEQPPVESLDTVEHHFEGAIEDTGEAEVVEAEIVEDDEQAGEEEHSDDDEDVLEETPEFLRDQPEDDELWFEQGEPKDFDF